MKAHVVPPQIDDSSTTAIVVWSADKINTELTGKANSSHTHTASDVTDFDTEVSNNTDVAANTGARHTQGSDTALDTGNANEVTAAALRSHLDAAGTMSTQDADSVDIDGGAIDGTAIGANSPAVVYATRLEVDGSTTPAQFYNEDGQAEFAGEVNSDVAPSAGYYHAMGMYGKRSRGTHASPTGVVENDRLLTLRAEGHNGTDFYAGARIDFVATDNWSGATRGSRIRITVNEDGTATARYFDVEGAFVAPLANNVSALGTTTRRWAGLYYQDNGLRGYNAGSTPSAVSGSAVLYVSAGELRVIDQSGNNTLLSPHAGLKKLMEFMTRAEAEAILNSRGSRHFIIEYSSETNTETLVDVVGLALDVQNGATEGKTYVWERTPKGRRARSQTRIKIESRRGKLQDRRNKWRNRHYGNA